MYPNVDNEFKYIIHARDHYSRFSWAIAAKRKDAITVRNFLIRIFSEYGSPKILHTDNGGEFIANVINQLIKACPTMKIIHGRPRHPQFQGSVERGNQELKKKIWAWMNDTQRTDWSNGLHFILCKLYLI